MKTSIKVSRLFAPTTAKKSLYGWVYSMGENNSLVMRVSSEVPCPKGYFPFLWLSECPTVIPVKSSQKLNFIGRAKVTTEGI